MTRYAAILCLGLGASPALADIPGCPRSDIPPAAHKGLQKAARREAAEPLDPATLYYCLYRDFARATVDTIPKPQSDGTELLGTLMCSGAADSARGWMCQVDRYRAVVLASGPGQPAVRVAVDERATPEATREYALRAFALLNEPGRVEACQRAAGFGQTTEGLRSIFAQRHGPYRLVISREGFALLRGGIQVRIRSANDFNPRAQLQCWEEHTLEE
jgi:hypothetical protein